ncbi:transglycosylase SLT domain-containing protein [uncultured Sphingomonas sp.]|uniref:transglycosylase SLT domain-containing protein n=1 Tax=uncultured Sphingomonas sp. TaxID=158754 RepID=UPI002601D445|nr:transglycosylase SLT domain-containing protein [uncultured Sphingomonas sp.]
MTPLAWGRRVAPDFRARVRAIADGLSTDPNYLMACMAFESAGTFRPDVKNGAGSGAVGLIQFMPQTAGQLHTTTGKLALMTAVDQLDFVDLYFRPWRGRMHNLGDVYMPILWPDAVGKPDSYVMFSEGDAHPARYLQNRGLDADHSGRITRGEVCAAVAAKLAAGMLPANAA